MLIECFAHTRTCTYVYTYTQMHNTHTHTHIYTHADTNILTHKNRNIQINTNTHTRIHACTKIYATRSREINKVVLVHGSIFNDSMIIAHVHIEPLSLTFRTITPCNIAVFSTTIEFNDNRPCTHK